MIEDLPILPANWGKVSWAQGKGEAEVKKSVDAGGP